MMEHAYMFAYFIIYAFVGWVCEDLYCGIPAKKFINRGFLYGPYCPIYGVGAVCVIYPLLSVINNPVLVFLIGVIITSVLEYITSWAMEKLFHTRWWDYSHYKFNIKGRVCLLNSTLFGIMCLVLMYCVHPKVEEIVRSIPTTYLLIFLSVFAIFFTIDFVFTTINMIKRMKLIEKAQAELEFLHEQFEKEKEEFKLESKETLDTFKQNAQLRFMEWTESREELSLKTKEIHEYFQKILYGHIGKAFPERKYLGGSTHLKEWLEEKRNR